MCYLKSFELDPSPMHKLNEQDLEYGNQYIDTLCQLVSIVEAGSIIYYPIRFSASKCK